MNRHWEGWHVGDDLTEDDLDVLTPGTYDADDPIELVPTVDGDVEGDEEQAPDPAVQGVADPLGCVRLWVANDRLTRVRVSPNWRQRIGSHRLADCFNAALIAAHIQVASDEPQAVEADFGELDFSLLPPLTDDTQAVLQSAIRDVDVRFQAALQALEATHVTGMPTPATSVTRKGVTVHLDSGGRLFDVEFADGSLELSEAPDIASRVMKAAAQAYAQHVPTASPSTEVDALITEQKLLVAVYEAMLTKEPS